MTPRRLIVGFGHKRFSGKDLCGDFAMRRLSSLGMPVCKDWFAASLKRMCQAAFGFTEAQVWSADKTKEDAFWKMTPARALQLAGTEAMRHTFGDDFWIRTLEKRVLTSPGINFVICDVRFPNEADAIRSWGGQVIRVTRVQKDPAEDGRSSQHLSETALDAYSNWYSTIINMGTVDDLGKQVYQLVDELLVTTLGWTGKLGG